MQQHRFKSFSQYITEARKEITVTFGRLNPPTIGHGKLLDAVARTASGGPYRIYLSQSQDPKKNPLDYRTKVKYVRKMFPKHARSVVMDRDVRNLFHVLHRVYEDGFNQVNLVVGSDRVAEFERLTAKYNGVKGRHGFYNFEGGVNVISAGERDPDAEGVSGMSASKMRSAAAANDFQAFSKGLPSGFTEGKELFNDVRKGMGLNESHDFRSHIQLQSVSEEREAYVSGDLFNEGDSVVITKTEEVGTIAFLGANYVIVETAEGKKFRKWISDVEQLDEGENVDRVQREKERAMDDLEDEYEGKLEDARRADEIEAEQERRREEQEREREQQDEDAVPDVEGDQPEGYYKGVDKKDKEARAKHFKRKSKLDDDDPAAYKPAPGDEDVKTKPSKYTKKYDKIYGEESVKSFTEFVTESNIDKALQNKADETGAPKGILKDVYDRGVAAWRTGHRPGTTPSQWGLARVNSFLTYGKTAKTADKDLFEKLPDGIQSKIKNA